MNRHGKEPRFHGKVSKKSHKNMSHIRGKDTSIEVKLRKALFAKGYRFRKNYKAVPGTPDIAFTKYRIAIFCDGEFFHGKDWDIKRQKVLQGTNGGYWVSKIERNIERDNEIDKELKVMDWTAIHFWGKDIQKNLDECIHVIEETIQDVKMRDE